MTKKSLISHTWDEGRLLDLWAFVHLISGSVMGLIASLLNYSTGILLFTAIALMVLWEIFEVIVNIGESIENRIIDVVVGVVGFLPAFFFAPEQTGEKVIVLVILIVLLATLEYLGWRAYSERISK